MPIQLHPDCKARLTAILAEGIPGIQTSHGKFLERLSVMLAIHKAERVIPDKGPVHEQLASYIGEFPIIEFVSDTLSLELTELDNYRADNPSAKLVEIKGYEDPRAVAERLVNQLEALPYRYTITAKLPEQLSALLEKFVTTYELSPTIRLSRHSAQFDTLYPLKSENERRQKRIHARSLLAIDVGDPTWDRNAVYLQIEANGFIGPYGGSNPEFEARRMLKALLGLGIALRLFDIEHKYNPFPTKSEFYIHKYVDGNWKIDNKINSSDAETRAFEAIRFSTLDGQLDDNDKKVAWAVTKLGNFRSIFSAGAKADAIILASQWLFDSYVGKDELLSYIQAMVVLEILLGDKAASEEIGLGQLLRNRCAYLISTTPKERAELLQDFNKIYEVRSQIVHRGKHRLNADERVLFHRLRWMCRRVIQEEVKLLETESKARA